MESTRRLRVCVDEWEVCAKDGLAGTSFEYAFDPILSTSDEEDPGRGKTYPCGQTSGLASVYEVKVLGRTYSGIV